MSQALTNQFLNKNLWNIKVGLCVVWLNKVLGEQFIVLGNSSYVLQTFFRVPLLWRSLSECLKEVLLPLQRYTKSATFELESFNLYSNPL